jgi:molybdopterin-guanine dinucleotide biosynthesis protein A
VDQVIINANGPPERFSAWALPVVADTIGGFAGPLAGVLAGMRWSQAHRPTARFVLTAAGDAPLLPCDLAERLHTGITQGAAIALAQSFGALHPVIGLWPLALADDLEERLRSGVRKVLDWTGRHATVAVPFAPVRLGGATIDPFFNANTPAELAQLRAAIAGDAP